MNSTLFRRIQGQLPTLILTLLSLILLPNLNAQDKVSFENDIKPIFENNCLRCHCEENMEGFRIDVKDEAMDYVVAEDPDESPIYTYLISEDEEELMPPPDEGGPLGDSDIQLIKTWIEEGAEWTDGLTWTVPEGGGGSGEVAKKEEGPQVTRAIGSLHAAAIHMPIGLFMAAGLFALLSLRGNFVMSDCAYYCLWLGVFGAIFACVSGWFFGPMEHYAEVNNWNDFSDTTKALFWHRTSAIVVTIGAFILAIFAAGARNRDPDDGMIWKLGVILLAAAIGYVGHEGGELSWNKDGKHYKDLEGLINQVVPIFEEKKPASSSSDDSAESGGAAAENGESDADTNSSNENDSTDSDGRNTNTEFQ